MLDNVSYQVDPEKAHQTFRSKKPRGISYGRLLKASWKLNYEILGTDEVIAWIPAHGHPKSYRWKLGRAE